MKVKIKDIKFRKDLYPRIEFKQELVEKYSNAIEFLSPIKIDQNNILIDGWHRWKAHQLANKDEIKVEIIQVESEKELRKLAYKLNSKHGSQLSNKDKSIYANEMIGEMPAKELAELLSVDADTIFSWTKTKRSALKEVRNEKVIRLYLKAEVTQKYIAEEMHESQGTISNIIQTFIKDPELQFFNESFKPYIYNIWRLAETDVETDGWHKFPRTFMSSLLYYFTEPFDTIYDPFASNGVTIDICKKHYRRYYCSDLIVTFGREGDMKQWNIRDGLPGELNYVKPNLVLLNLLGKQSETIHINNFLEKIMSKKINRIAMVSQMLPCDSYFPIFGFHRVIGTKYKIQMRCLLPYRVPVYEDKQIEIAKKERRCLINFRDLVVWEIIKKKKEK